MNRIPPHSEESERAILGSILLETSVIHLCVEAGVSDETFYVPAHRSIYKVICELSGLGFAVDVTTVISRMKQLGIESPDNFLDGLIDSTPTALHAQNYIEIARNKEMLRKAITLSREMENQAYEGESPKTILASGVVGISEILHASRKKRTPESFHQEHIERRDRARSRGVVGYPIAMPDDMGSIINSWVPPDNIVIGAKSSAGKTMFMLNEVIPQVRIGVPVAIFSTDMTEYALRQRMAARIADVNAFKFGKPYWTELDASRIDKAYEEINKWPVFINDDSNASCDELISWATAMIAKYGVKFLFVDFIQQLNRTHSERREDLRIVIGEWSKRIKSFGKRFNTVTFVISQLARYGEKASDKTPPVPNKEALKECLAVNSTLLLTPSGYLCNHTSNMNVVTLTKRGIEYMKSINIPKQTNETIKVELRSGRFIECTKKHKVYTDKGWVPAAELTKHHAIACVRKIPEPNGVKYIPESHWIGLMLGDGCMLKYYAPSFTSSDNVIADSFLKETEKLFGIKAKEKKVFNTTKARQFDITSPGNPDGNKCRQFLYTNDLWGRKSHEKIIPDWFVATANNKSITELLAGLFEADGSIYKHGPTCILKLSTTSTMMVWQVLWAFSRLGIYPRVYWNYLPKKNPTYKGKAIRALHPQHTISLTDKEIVAFRNLIPIIGDKKIKLESFRISNKQNNFADRVGTWVGADIVEQAKKEGMTIEKFGYRDQAKKISQADLSVQIKKLKNKLGLDRLINPNIYWDMLKDVKDAGVQQVFDRNVPVTHNFVANGIIVHNSGDLEQNADIVGLLAYAPDKPKAEFTFENPIWDLVLNIDKQRDGPTGMIDLCLKPSTGEFMSRTRGTLIREEHQEKERQKILSNTQKNNQK